MALKNFLEEIRAELEANSCFYTETELGWFNENLDGIEDKTPEVRNPICSGLLKGLRAMMEKNNRECMWDKRDSNRFLIDMISQMRSC